MFQALLCKQQEMYVMLYAPRTELSVDRHTHMFMLACDFGRTLQTYRP